MKFDVVSHKLLEESGFSCSPHLGCQRKKPGPGMDRGEASGTLSGGGFNGEPQLLNEVFDARPEVFAHNVETVPRIFKRIRPGFRYERSLEVLRMSRAEGLVTKSNLILGMGETREEISQALQDLYDAGAELITITQYLRPTVRHHPIDRWVTPEEFDELAEEATQIGFVTGRKRMSKQDFSDASDNLIRIILKGCGLTPPTSA